jgi:hypothetical protein
MKSRKSKEKNKYLKQFQNLLYSYIVRVIDKVFVLSIDSILSKLQAESNVCGTFQITRRLFDVKLKTIVRAHSGSLLVSNENNEQ